MSRRTSADANSNVISLADEEAVKQVLVESVLGLWDVVNNLTRLDAVARERYRVTIFGSARVQPGTSGVRGVSAGGRLWPTMGCDIITGGGPGLMQAANEGRPRRRRSRDRSVGIRVDLPFEQDVNPFVDQAFEHRNVFHAAAPFRAHLGCVRGRPGRHRHACSS